MIRAAALEAGTWLRGVVPLTADLSSDSRQIARGDVFIAYPGEKFDGRRFVPAAIANGASAVLFDPRDGFQLAVESAVPALAVDDLKLLAGEIAASWYGEPSRRLYSIGVTGTSGKSTSALWLAQLFEALGHRCALIGTLGAGMLGDLTDTGHTTPDPVALERLLAKLVRQGANVMAMEVTSVGLVEGRVNGLCFDVVLFTNLSRDHLDYHGSMDAYRDAKASLFGWSGLLAGVINLDDQASTAMRAAMTSEVEAVTFSAAGKSEADLYATAIEPLDRSTRLSLAGRFGVRQIEAPIVGRYNVDNLLGVLAVALASGVEFEQIVAALGHISAAPGRLQPVMGDGEHALAGPLTLIDYAHKPDALEKALQACRPLAEQRGGQLIAVFGCGGDRDRGKRSIMGEIGARLADRVLLTSDNPRSEAPETILEEIFQGVPLELRSKVVRLADRRAAIERALGAADSKDVVLIAGKGHEDYQDIGGVKHPFSDLLEARRVLASKSQVASC